MNLFDDFARTDPAPRHGNEDDFAFLNRAATPFWHSVRELLVAWFSRYPSEQAGELRKRFRSKLPGDHWGAWWELYLHELLLRLDYEIKLHPELPDSSKTPDVELRRGTSRLFLEASVVFSGLESRQDPAPPWLIEAIDQTTAPDFFVRVVEVRAGEQQLRERQISDRLQRWLDRLDPDQAAQDHEQGLGFPQETITLRGWEVVLEAWPVKQEARGEPGHRVYGAGPIQTGYANDIEQLKSKLKAKAGRYGRPEIPLVTAVLCVSPVMNSLDIEQALFGRETFQVSVDGPPTSKLVRQRNGFWMYSSGPQNQRVSAVLAGVGLAPWSVPRVSPYLWLNPWADHSFRENWPFPHATANERGDIVHSESKSKMAALFDLPPDWPGKEPFPRG
jgi:hypothetical protein